MAYVEEYFLQWNDKGGTTHQVKLLLEGGAGPTTELIYGQTTPYTHQVRGGKDFPLESQIAGSEVNVNFIVGESDITAIDAIFESNYKDWKIEHYYNSVLDWSGWLQPENYSRQYISDGNWYQVSLSAVDGLANLKNIEFVDATTGAQFEDRVTIMTTLKRALEHVGHELDFKVQLMTWCSNVGAAMDDEDCALDKCTCDSRRFIEAKDGRIVNTNCYEVISELLKPFGSYLIQSQGFYWIINPYDGATNSFVFNILWSDLSVASRVGSDLRVDILANEKDRNNGEQQKIRPFETVGLSFRDRNLGDSLLTNGDFVTPSTSEWNNSGDIVGTILGTSAFEANYELSYDIDVDAHAVPITTAAGFYSDAHTIASIADDDQIQVTYSLRCVDITMDAGYVGDSFNEKTKVTCQLRQGTASGTIISAVSSLPATIGETESAYTIYTANFNFSDDDDYFVEFLIDKVSALAWTDYDFIDVRFDDISIVTKFSTGDDITFDRYFKVNNTDSSFIDTHELELKFGDSKSDADIAAFKIGGTRTETWNRWLQTEDISINILAAQNLIENYGKYKDYLNRTIIDDTDRLFPHILISLGSPNFQIVSQTSVFGGGLDKEITVELVEVVRNSVTTTIQETGLNTVDSDPNPGDTFVQNPIPNNPPGITDHGGLTGLSDDDHPQYDQTLQEVTDNGATTDNDIIISGDIDGVRMIKVQNESTGVSASPMLFFKGDTSTSTIFVPSSAYSVASLRNKTIFYNSTAGFIWRTTGTDTMELSSLGVLNAAVNLQENGTDISAIYEAIFSKNSGFNKNLGISSGTVSEGDHDHAVGLIILNAGVLTLNTSPQQILNAAGSNNLWVPEKVTLRHVFVSAAFATNTTLQIGIGTSSGSAVYVDLASSVLTSVADQIDIETIPDFTNVVSNSRVYIKVKTGDPTAGGGSLRIQIIYKKLTSI